MQYVAKRIWQEGKEIFQLRMNMVDQIAELAARNCHWYQPSEMTAAKTERSAIWYFRRYGLDDLSEACNTAPDKLLYNPVVFSGECSSWRLKTFAPNKISPSEIEIQHLIATRGKFWKKVGDDWHCPCCHRAKKDCIRPSKNNPWVFEIKHKQLFSLEKGKNYSFEEICEDCANTANHLGREAASATGKTLEYPSSAVELNELRSIIICHQHTPHTINNSIVDNLLPILVNRINHMP